MNRKALVLSLLMLIPIFITGCWSRREMNELAIAVGIGIDKAGDQYKVSVQVVEPNQIAGTKGVSSLSPVNLYQTTGATVLEALRKITMNSPRKIYLAHLRMLILGEDLAKEGIDKVLDFLSRDTEVRNDYFLVVARNALAEDTLKILTSLEKVPSNKLHSSLRSAEKYWAPASTVTLANLIGSLIAKGKHPVLSGLEIKGNLATGETEDNVSRVRNAALLEYTGLAVFNKDKLVGWLDESDSKTYSYLQNHVNNTVSFVEYHNRGKVGIRIFKAHSKMKGSVHNGVPQITIIQNVEADIEEVQSKNLDLTDTATITELEELLNQKIEHMFKTSVQKVQKNFKVDSFGFGEVIHRSNPQEWKTLQKNWDQHFINLSVNVESNVQIRQLGKVSNSFLEEME